MRIIVVGGSICPVIRQTLQDLHDVQFTEDAGSLDTLDALLEPETPAQEAQAAPSQVIIGRKT